MAKFLDETGLATVWGKVKARGGKVVTGSYTGAGGSSKTINLGGRPALFVLAFEGFGYSVVFFDVDTNIVGYQLGDSSKSATNVTNSACSGGNTITSTGITIVDTTSTGKKFFGNSGVDRSGTTYHYVAVLE